MNYRFSKTLEAFSSSAVREILKLTQGSSIISFAGGLPAEEFFPIDAVKEALARVMEGGTSAMQYGLTEGYVPLRQSICKRMAAKGMNVTPDDMMLTTGSQQTIDLLTRIYVDEGDVILVERPTYLAAIQVFQARGARIVSVQSDRHGMDLDDLAAQIREHKPKMVYVNPNFSNPAGRVWSLERRQGLLEACRSNDVLILEDDPYGELRFGTTEVLPSIFSLDQHPEGSCVVYTSTFSKIVAPALRTGWVMGDRSVIRAIAQAKQAADLQSSTLDQQTLYQLMEHFDMDAHIELISTEYEKRMQYMVQLLREKNWPGVVWNDPQGGMFIWLELPPHIDTQALLPTAVQHGVAYVPGVSFYADQPLRNTMRLNFTYSSPEVLKLGMERLDAVLKPVLAGTSSL
ncbi:PLP-dependent aminotransferase family protein [Paenibacillus lutrae]|uniref:Aminotransferase class I/II-fold pyridoxal phosphate-dependent enzyme n=1 Tax=Paenibacillus lutrae TaxID=2078573 RepID=A0A7X3JY55_9BACL|nr:PLP-dependent aminotransferase family protein [Paenibacillus lutrae]MVO98748.1 aminotransferase class I/II-fold pyridoxal phosphate-dependent enzyme [Paenibacillus lutrae]